MNRDKIVKSVAVIGGAAAAVFLLRKIAEGAMGAAITISVLDAFGSEIPHNSVVELEPGGSYTIEATVTNLSTSRGEPAGATLTTRIFAVADAIPLMEADMRTDSYGPGESLVLTWPLDVPADMAPSSGAISATVLDPSGNKLAEVSLGISIAIAMRPAINGMGDLDNDGYVSDQDIAILNQYIAQSAFAGFDIHSISPLSWWEFVRRADLNCDTNINATDKTAIENFIIYGTLPEPLVGSRAAVNSMGDLNDDGYVNSVDIILCYLLMNFPASEVSPLSEAEVLRRADLNGDGQINVLDILIMMNFINTGELPQPVVYAASVDVGLEGL